MSKRKQEETVNYGGHQEPYNTDNIGDYFEFVERDKDGTILVRRKPNTDSGTQKAVDGLAAWLGLFLGR